MAFRQSAPPTTSRRYSTPSQQFAAESHVSQARGHLAHFEPHLGPISDFGSLNTIPQSGEEELSDVIQDVADDLDSLDEGLHAFQEPLVYKASDVQNSAILPAHDGLGSFHPATQGQTSIINTEGQLSLQPETFSRFHDLRDRIIEEESLEISRHERIERWRLEQSKVVLEEIEKERQRTEARQRLQDRKSGTNSITAATKDISSEHQSLEDTGNETIWQRLARHVMKDFIGLDDTVLSAIFGEDLMPEEALSKTPTPDFPLPIETQDDVHNHGFLQKLIKELRQLAQGLSSDTPITHEELVDRLDYAGIPLAWLEDRDRVTSMRSNPSSSAQFKPTLQSSETKPTPAEPATAESDYWEQTPNLKSVITYLYRRFRSASIASKSHTIPNTLPRTLDAAHRAAIIQQHHPLTSRRDTHYHAHHPFHARNPKTRRQSSFLSSHKAASANLKRPGSSCASWSTKRSRWGESNGSRNYWDIGAESVASGSLVFAGVGAWGEV